MGNKILIRREEGGIRENSNIVNALQQNQTPFNLYFVSGLWLLIILSVVGIILSPWQSAPVYESIRYIFSSYVIINNLKQLFHWKGGYAESLWGFLVFLPISSLFFWAGRVAFRYILSKFDSETKLSTTELLGLSWLLGSWLWGMVWFVLGLFGFFKQAIAISFLIFGLVLLIIQIYQVRKYNWSKFFHPYLKMDIWSFGLLLAALWIISWLGYASIPQFFWDTLVTNLSLPAYYIAESKLIPNPFHIFSYYPQNSELLTVWILLCKSQPYLLTWGFFVALTIFLYGWIKRVTSKEIAFIAVGIFVFCPVGFWLGTIIKEDLQVACFIVLQWWALGFAFKYYLQNQKSFRIWLTLSGIFAGIAYGHKVSALPAVVTTALCVGAFYILKNPNSFKEKIWESLKSLSFYLSGFLLAAGCWLGRNFVITGNPFYPFLNSLFNTQPLYSWHTNIFEFVSQKDFFSRVFSGFVEYFANLTQIRPVGHLGADIIWWGPTTWICGISFICLTKLAQTEFRWIYFIAVMSWIVTLFSQLEHLYPRYHYGILIFLFCFCFGYALHIIFCHIQFRIFKYAVAIVAFLEFLRQFMLLVVSSKRIVFPLAVFLSGSPHYHYIVDNTAGTPYLASIDEMALIHHLVNKHTPKDDRVLFMGSFRSAGIERPHYVAETRAKQPILYFAEQCKDSTELRDKLLSLGIRHIIYDPSGWEKWVKNETVDGPHNLTVSNEDLQKIEELPKILRFESWNGRIKWYSITRNSSEYYDPITFDSDDVYLFPFHAAYLARDLHQKGKDEEAFQLLKLIIPYRVHPNVVAEVHDRLGVIYSERKQYEEAIKHFSIAIEQNTKQLHIIRNRALAYEYNIQIDLAIQDWSKLIELNPSNAFYREKKKELLGRKEKNNG